ncbi:MAG TPA: M56 family metallopeptidase, partial [Bryobacteraceae bacterium]|nr:M56 family metallopeptidase [Bryobacteraceae bacterium]
VNHLWQSTLFAALAAAIVFTLLRQNSAQTRYTVWLAASIKFLVPFAALMDFGRQLGVRLALMRVATPATQAKVYYALDEFGRRTAPRFMPSALVPAGRAPGSLLPQLLLTIWICGAVIVAARWCLAWWRVRDALRGARPMRTFDGIPVLSSTVLRRRGFEPGVFGFLRAVVLVPEGITERLSPEQFEAVLAHECCHARRRDNLLAAVQMAVEALFWFHPLVWWMGTQITRERERACDEDVLRRNNDPEVYAEGILNVCKFYMESPVRCVAGITGADLKRRIEEIMSRRMPRELNWARTVVLALAGSASILGPIGFGLLRIPVTHAQTISPFDGRMRTSAVKQFEVATVRENRSGGDGWRLGPPQHGGVSIDNLQLHRIIASSFQIQDSLVFGPDWLNSTRYDIVGKGPDPSVTNPEVWEMMRSLLAERFHLKYHVESRQLPIYALTVAKGGPKLKRPEDGPCGEKIRAGESCAGIGPIAPFAAGITNTTIGALVSALARSVQDRPIVDKTGLTGKYDALVRWMPDNMKPGDFANVAPELRPDDVSLFTALEEQLGLKLEAQKGPIDVLVVDSIEKPSDVAGTQTPQIDDRIRQ